MELLGMTAVLAMAVTHVLVTNGKYMQPYHVPRETWHCIMGVYMLAWWFARGGPVGLSPGALFLAVLALAVWFLSAAMGLRPYIAIRHFLFFGFSLCFGLFFTTGINPVFLIRVFVAMAAVSATVALIEHRGHVRVFPAIKSRKRFEPAGLVGNPNAHAAYLQIHFILALYLVIHDHFMWLAPAAVIEWAMVECRCRAAVAAQAIVLVIFLIYEKLLWLMPYLLIFSVMAVASYWDRWKANPYSLRERIRTWQVAWEQVKKTPLFGVGFNNWVVRVPWLQRGLNKRTNGAFLDRENFEAPWPELAHNDLLQALVDCGCAGVGVVGALLLLCAYRFFTQPAEAWAAYAAMAMVGYILSGVLFHVSYYLPINLCFFSLMGMLLRGSAITVPGPGVWMIPVLAAAAYLVWRYPVRHARFSGHFSRFLTGGQKEEKYLKAALRCEPDNSMANMMAVSFASRANNAGLWFAHTMKSIERHDGQTKLWLSYVTLGNLFLMNNAPVLADAAYNQALEMCPWDMGALIGKEHLKTAEWIVTRRG